MHAASAAWTALRTLAEACAHRLSSGDPRRLRGLIVALLVIGLLGPGRPLIVSISERTGTTKIRTLARADDGRIVPPGSDGWRAKVRVEGAASSAALLPPPTAAKRTALIIGINNARGGQPLPGSVTDANNVHDALIGFGFLERNVTMLLEQDASKANIQRELARLATRTPADGVAVFSLATHTRRRGGTNEFLTADGLRISAPELASALDKVRSKTWTNLATCYAAGYDIPGIVGHDRVVTFASGAADPTYQLGSAGSYLVINMVQSAMLEGRAPTSVEAAFRYAEQTLQRDRPTRVPTMSDGVDGELVLGRPTAALLARHRGAGDDDGFFSSGGGTADEKAPAPPPEDDADEAPEADPRNRGDLGVSVCGHVSVRCRND